MPKHVSVASHKKIHRHIQALLGNTVLTVMACAGLALLLGAMTVGAARFVAQTPKTPAQAPAPMPAETTPTDPHTQPAEPRQTVAEKAAVEQSVPEPAPTPEPAPIPARPGANRSQRAIEVLTPKPHSPLNAPPKVKPSRSDVTIQATTPFADLTFETASAHISTSITTSLGLAVHL